MFMFLESDYLYKIFKAIFLRSAANEGGGEGTQATVAKLCRVIAVTPEIICYLTTLLWFCLSLDIQIDHSATHATFYHHLLQFLKNDEQKSFTNALLKMWNQIGYLAIDVAEAEGVAAGVSQV
ncbi:hypothetical protein FRB93_011533 [Tulasnella sp. JGI-2019a]|nr:hypothetical protein FRB93_011533 [Tulasnella sp. JGI-2019a]